MTILCEPDQETAQSLVAVLDGDVQTVADLPTAALTVAADPGERVVVVGSDVAMDLVLSFSDSVRVERPDVRVIVLRDEVDDALRSAAQNAGIEAIVPVDDAQQITAAYHAAHGPVAETAPVAAPELTAPQRGRIVTVFSTKGGVGRTTAAINLAAALNDGGRRRVCLVDLDLAFGDVAISLSLAPSRTIIDAVAPDFAGTPDEHLDALLTTYAPGFDCILAPVEPGDADVVPTDLVGYVLRQLAQRYEYVVVDTPAQFSEHVLTSLDESDPQLLVTTPEIPALKNLNLTIDMLDVLGYDPRRRAVVLNEADSKLGVDVAQLRGAIRAPIVLELPFTKDVALSVNSGKPLVLSKPDGPYSQAMRTFADTVLAGEHSAGTQRSRRFGRRDSKTGSQTA